MPDVLSEVRSGLEKRLHELEPLIEEHAQVRAALDALKGAGTRAERAVRTAPKERRAARTAGATSGRGRPRGTGGRAQEALKLVHQQPGITIAEMAKRMKIQANYLYRVLPHLEKDGKIKKQDKGYHPADS
jgi:predicted Rossmann fold nucleotide-binding protein DprA/Smf involved in DNA uptake